MDSNFKKQSSEMIVPRFVGWPTTPNRPMPPMITLLFKGLTMFCYNRTEKRCEIGFHRDEDGRHPLNIKVSENGVPVSLPFPSTKRMMTLSLGTTPNVSFLEQGSDYDFKKMLDLNTTEFYPGKSPEPFDMRLFVNHGTFFCQELTKYRFNRVNVPVVILEPVLSPSNHFTLGHFLNVAAAEIPLMANQQVSFIVDGTEKRLPETVGQGHSCTILFDNACKENGHECKFEFDSRFETRRGDFHHHREALSLSVLEPKYGLLLAPGQLTEDGLDINTKKVPQGSDRAPCMAVGLSQTDPLP